MRKGAFFFGVVIGFSGVLISPLEAEQRLEPGTPVTVYLEAAGNQPEPDPGPPTDKLVFTGGRTFSIELPGCTDTSLPLRNAVLVDANGPRSSRTVSAIARIEPSGTEVVAIPPGTRLIQFLSAGSCTSGGIAYRKYISIVE